MKSRIITISTILFCFITNISAQFVPTTGPSGGGYVSCFLKDGNTVWAGIQNDLYKSNDNGSNWTKVVVAADASDFKCLAKAGRFVFAASNNGKIRLFKSDDDGNTWTGVQNGLPESSGFAVYSPTQMAVIKDTLFLGTTTAGVKKTADYGQNWTSTQQNGGCVNEVFAKGDTLVIGGAGIGKPKWSSDFGQTLTDFASNIYMISTLAFNNCVAIDYRNGRLFFTTTYGSVNNFYTDDWGTTIVQSSGALNPNTIAVAGSKVYTSSSDFSKFYVSTDNGTTFTEEKINGNSMSCSVIYDDGTLVWLGPVTWSASTGAIYYGVYNASNARATWQEKNNGLNFMNVTKLANTGNTVFALASKIYKSVDMGASWSIADTTKYTSISTEGSTIYGCHTLGLNKSTDNGTTWTAITFFDGKAVTAFVANGQLMIAGISTELWLSTDGGANWNMKTIGGSMPNNRIIKSFHKHNSTVWLAELTGGFILTSDGGTTWTYTSGSYPSYFATQGTRLLQLLSQGFETMQVSNNGGANFRNFSNGLPGGMFGAYGGLFVNGTTAYVYNSSAGSLGLYSLSTTDTIWQKVSNTAGMASYPKSAMVDVNGILFASPANSSVWKLDSNTTSVNKNILKDKNMVNIYPNPFNSSLNILFLNFEQGIMNYEIDIYDIVGKTIHHQSLNSKQELLNLDKPKGIYFYKIKNNKETIASGKLIIQ